MMKRIVLFGFALVALALVGVETSAQKDTKKYKEEAAAFRKQIWSWDKPEFKIREAPANLAHFSRIILAKHMDFTAQTNSMTKFSVMELTRYKEMLITETIRELVKINDKAAINFYSEMTFKRLEKSRSIAMDEKSTTYVGLRIIKPNGSIIEINEDDAVLTKEDKNTQEAKLAVPGLEVGDILDYFILKYKNTEEAKNSTVGIYTLQLYDEVPILNYSITGTFGKNCSVEYRLYNNSPDFNVVKTAEGDNILTLEHKNLAAITPNDLWISPYRQLPIIKMNIDYASKESRGTKNNNRGAGKVYRNQSADEFIQDKLISLSDQKKAPGLGYAILGDTKGYFSSIMKKSKKLDRDSLLAELFYIIRFDKLLEVYTTEGAEKIANWGKARVFENYLLGLFGEMLASRDLKNELVFVTSYMSPRLSEIMDYYDIDYLIKPESPSGKFFGVSDIFSPAFHIPYKFENMKEAIPVNLKGLNVTKVKDFEVGNKIAIPSTTADQNKRIEKLNINILTTDNSLQVVRRTTLKGHYKSDVQKQLILFEDYYNSEAIAFGTPNIIDHYARYKALKNFVEELKIAFKKVRERQKGDFSEEAKNWFDAEIIDLKNPKVENLGVRHTSPDFIYSSEFKANGIVKRAGNNLIVEVGKLQGAPLKIESEQKQRTLDIYMPFARSTESEIVLQIPDGFTAEGVEALNKRVENESGHFACTAKLEGKTVIIKVSRAYNHAFQPAANWSKLLAFIDAGYEFSNSRILLRKF